GGIRDDGARLARIGLRRGDGHARQHGTALVGDATADLSGRQLRQNGAGEEQQEPEDDNEPYDACHGRNSFGLEAGGFYSLWTLTSSSLDPTDIASARRARGCR